MGDLDRELGLLAERVASGEAEAEAALCAAFQVRIRKLITVMLFRRRVPQPDLVAWELAQETLLRAVRRLRQGELRKSDSLAAFLHGIARNVSSEYVDKEKLDRRVELDGLEPATDSAADPERRLLQEESSRLSARILKGLGPRDREVLRHFYLHGRSKAEICADFGLNGGQFDQIKSRALRRARSLYVRWGAGRVRRVFPGR